MSDLRFSRLPVTQQMSLLLAILGVGLMAFWLNESRLHDFPDAPAGEFACLSYTPSSDSSKGAADNIHAQIEQDLLQLSKRTHCVRTYSVMNGLDYVPQAARKLGMRVLLGIWIGSNHQANEQEISQAIATASTQGDVIDAIIVGNEVLLRREQTAEALYGMLKRVHDATQLPVTYADVWDFWLKNPQLAEVSDFVSIHILPYWDDQPIGVDQAMAHVQQIFSKLQQKFPDKRIYVGETGWPSEGRQREAAKPSLINQARFTREFIALASQQNIPYNFIEAYDQPWKKRLEGTVGGYWGLYDAQGRAKFLLTGTVQADAMWWRGPLAGVGMALLLWLGTLRMQHIGVTTLQATLAGFSLGCIGVLQWDSLWQSNQNWQEWLAMCSFAALGHVLFIWRIAAPATQAKTWSAALLIWLISLSYINLGLVFDARYRDFPTAFVLLPIVLLLPGSLNAARLTSSGEGVLLGSWLLLSAVTIGWIEGISNHSALCWCALSALLGLRVMLDHFSGRVVADAMPSMH